MKEFECFREAYLSPDRKAQTKKKAMLIACNLGFSITIVVKRRPVQDANVQHHSFESLGLLPVLKLTRGSFEQVLS